MKKIKIYIFVFISTLFNPVLHGQFSCFIIEDTISLKTSGVIANVENYIPDSNTSVKYIRVNIHFFLLEVDHPDYPGNFTKSEDGYGDNSFTGYDYASLVIEKANERLSQNSQLNLPFNNSIEVLQRKYRYILNGVFFHEENDFYYYPNYNANSTYGENLGECINIFFSNANGASGGGHANMSGYRYLEMRGTWERYYDDIDSGRGIESGLWVYAGGINHEVGHNLSLLHTMRTPWGICSDDIEDYCPDTPTRGEIINNWGVDPCCGWSGGDSCTNNLMDYCKHDAISPYQLGRIHWTIANEIEEYKSCYYINDTFQIMNFTDNKAFIARNIIISSGASIQISSGDKMFIRSENFRIEGSFNMELGAMLTTRHEQNCN